MFAAPLWPSCDGLIHQAERVYQNITLILKKNT